MSQTILDIRDLHVSITEDPENRIVNGINLEIKAGEVHALMGPNGSGKSTLASTVAGSPVYNIDSGEIFFKNEDITTLPADERARKGMFLSFQYPTAIPGVTMVNLMREALKARRGNDVPAREFLSELRDTLKTLKMDENFARRYVNDGFSGGEKKRFEIVQMMLLNPKLIILDETDSGLDIDALKIVAKGINSFRNKKNSFILITHYHRMLDFLDPNHVHILIDGHIALSGGAELAKDLEEKGYGWIKESIKK